MNHERINDDNYFVVHGWMIKRLSLSGTKLLIYAIIYGFSQDGECEYSGGINYLCNFCAVNSRHTIINALNNLTEDGLILRNETKVNGVKFVRYSVNRAMIPMYNNCTGGAKIALGGCKNCTGGSAEFAPNKEIYKEINKESVLGTHTQKDTAKRFSPPTIEEVEAYCRERQNGIDARRFVDYYTANGWKVGKNAMKDWKAAVRMWERNQTQGGRQAAQESGAKSFETDEFFMAAVNARRKES